ncbi:Histidine kinase-, DNA gyrase B-, and HSP90-like ATPase [Gaiella occulta]|uniref:histidine kinase n=1 Tax=Gaiella occulta TaxID=1002870 RepID=A0A7M2YUA5_9ACTN|nr:ATP-binding protein [Gaiella occulta]RDI73656.1 Histidine kinase-, DNA gyrase B-, and HSP90-like ATPase [Gaiella occulta]
MTSFARLGLRARLAIALVSVAVLTVGLATLLANRGLPPLVDDAARSRLQRSAAHVAGIAAAVYRDEGGWSPAARETVAHVAALDGLRIVVRIDGRRYGPDLTSAVTADAAVTVGGRRVGSVEVAQEGDGLLTPEEAHLQHALDRLHLAAGAAAAVAALLLAFVLAETLSRPLRRIRVAAQRIGQGDLSVRVEPVGDPEVRSVAQALNRLAETLEHEEEIRKQTVADLAHELRTPVNGLLARIEAAQDGVLTGHDNLEAMHEEALRLTRLLDDLSRLADAEQPGLLLEKQPLDLGEVVRSTGASFSPRFADAGVGFDVHVRPAWVDGNAGRLEQVVSNLLSNALRYTERGGSVTVAVGRTGNEAVLEVADTGIGIEPDDLRHVFTRFWRGDRSRSPATGGSGIGLAIVRELVRAHDGRIDVDSTVGKGSRFRVVLPAVERPTPAKHPAPELDRAGT